MKHAQFVEVVHLRRGTLVLAPHLFHVPQFARGVRLDKVGKQADVALLQLDQFCLRALGPQEPLQTRGEGGGVAVLNG
jgi:hypothetical protein